MMKNANWLLLFPLFVYDIFGNDDLLTKFHQHGFKIKDFRMDLIRCDAKYFNFFQIKTFKYNRTTPAVNITLRMKISVEDKTEVLVQSYKFLSNEFRHFPVRFQLNAQKIFEANVAGLAAGFKRCGNLTSFIFKKDVTYHMCNFAPDESQLPPLIPNGIFKTAIALLYLQKEVAFIETVAEIYTPMEYPKK